MNILCGCHFMRTFYERKNKLKREKMNLFLSSFHELVKVICFLFTIFFVGTLIPRIFFSPSFEEKKMQTNLIRHKTKIDAFVKITS